MIDTLKLARRLEGAGMSRSQADGVAEALAEGVQGDTGERFDRIDARLDRIDGRFDRVDARFIALESRTASLESDVKLLKWMAGANIALTIGVLLKLLVV